MEIARKSKKDQKKIFFQRKQQIFEYKAEKMKTALEEKDKKARNLLSLKESLTVEINKAGLWVDESAIDSSLEVLPTVKQKKEALKLQLDFRSKVLDTKCDRSLFFLSVKGVNRNVQDLKASLVKVISWKDKVVNSSELKIFSQPVVLSSEVVLSQKPHYFNGARETCKKLSLNLMKVIPHWRFHQKERLEIHLEI